MAVDDAGCVDCATVLEVLKCHRVSIGPDPDYPGQTVLAKGNKIDSRTLPDWFERDVLQFFKRTFGVPITHFYHPDWARRMVEIRKIK